MMLRGTGLNVHSQWNLRWRRTWWSVRRSASAHDLVGVTAELAAARSEAGSLWAACVERRDSRSATCRSLVSLAIASRGLCEDLR